MLFLLVQYKVQAQEQSLFQIWSDYNLSYKLDQNLSVGGDLGYRITPENGKQLGFIRPMVGYRLNPMISLKSGFANFNIWEDELNKSFELRPFVFIHMSWPRLEAIKVVQRFGLEQRWFKIQPGSMRKSNQRYRYLVELQSSEVKLLSDNLILNFLINVEFFRDTSNKNINRLFDHNRLSIAGQSRISETIKIEVRYTLVSLLNISEDRFERRFDVLRLRLFHTL